MKDIHTALARCLALVALLLAGATAAQAAVIATPDAVTITSPTQKVTIRLTQDGEPLVEQAIKGFSFLVDESNYARMITFQKKDGAVVITPSELAEVGSYALVIKTAYGDVRVAVDMPLSDLPDPLVKQAEAAGITVDELKVRLGIASRHPREKVDFDFSQGYHVGSTLLIQTPCPEERTYEWRVNGEVVQRGIGPEPFEYTFTAAGEYKIEYRDALDGRPIASGSGTAIVTERPKDATKP